MRGEQPCCPKPRLTGFQAKPPWDNIQRSSRQAGASSNEPQATTEEQVNGTWTLVHPLKEGHAQSEAAIFSEQPLWSERGGWCATGDLEPARYGFIVVMPGGALKEVGRDILDGLGYMRTHVLLGSICTA